MLKITTRMWYNPWLIYRVIAVLILSGLGQWILRGLWYSHFQFSILGLFENAIRMFFGWETPARDRKRILYNGVRSLMVFNRHDCISDDRTWQVRCWINPFFYLRKWFQSLNRFQIHLCVEYNALKVVYRRSLSFQSAFSEKKQFDNISISLACVFRIPSKQHGLDQWILFPLFRKPSLSEIFEERFLSEQFAGNS